ncbi:MAG: choice-of-anchor J domain-containing protein [Phycisphaerales bacterium]|nr:choice-of-anchor J domain-containing protein [Phycisphaerales bacterium]
MRKGNIKTILFFIVICLKASTIFAQSDKCGTMIWLNNLFQKNKNYQTLYATNELKLDSLEEAYLQNFTIQAPVKMEVNTIDSFPVVFHIVLPSPAIITNSQINQQIERLNLDWSGFNSDSNNIPSNFQAVRGHSPIRFTLAKRTPDNQLTNGIVRVSSGTKSGLDQLDPIKSPALGGDTVWDAKRYINIWVGVFDPNTTPVGLVGYTTFPIGSPENTYDLSQQGIVLQYLSITGSPIAVLNLGRTAVHEMGHYFWLRHVWGDGVCVSDFPNTLSLDDTPFQNDATTNCPTGTVVAGCDNAPTPPGRQYQNYMDYTEDPCYSMFSKGQNIRSQIALDNFRTSLLTSNGGVPPSPYDVTVTIKNPNPNSSICSGNTITPTVQLINYSTTFAVRNLSIITQLDGGTPITQSWQGNLSAWPGSITPANSTTVSLTPYTQLSQGLHKLVITVTQPNGTTGEQDLTNNVDSISFVVGSLPLPINENFDGTIFPPLGWDTISMLSNNSINWQQTFLAGNGGPGSAYINFYNNPNIGQQNYLIAPVINLKGYNSGLLSFQYAYTQYSADFSDSLQVVASNDCGQTWKVLWSKGGADLSTTKGAYNTDNFYPVNTSQWSNQPTIVDLSAYANNQDFLVAFRAVNGNGNNLFLDKVSINGRNLAPNYDNETFLAYPVPTLNTLILEVTKIPTALSEINIFDILGNRVRQILVTDSMQKFTAVDMSRLQTGIYTVQMLFGKSMVAKQIFKLDK